MQSIQMSTSYLKFKRRHHWQSCYIWAGTYLLLCFYILVRGLNGGILILSYYEDPWLEAATIPMAYLLFHLNCPKFQNIGLIVDRFFSEIV